MNSGVQNHTGDQLQPCISSHIHQGRLLLCAELGRACRAPGRGSSSGWERCSPPVPNRTYLSSYKRGGGRAGHGSPENRQTLCPVGLFKPPKEQFGSFIISAHKTHTPNETPVLTDGGGILVPPAPRYTIYIFSSTFV